MSSISSSNAIFRGLPEFIDFSEATSDAQEIITQIIPSQDVPKKRDNGEFFNQTPIRDRTYLTVDGGGVVRNITQVVTSSSELAGKVTAATVAVIGAGIAMSAVLLGAGFANLYATHYWSIPDARRNLETAEMAVRKLESTYFPGFSIKEMNTALEDAEVGLEIAEGILQNHLWYKRMAKAQIATGGLSLVSGIAALKVSSPVVTAAAGASSAVAGGVLGAVCVLRGGIIIKRANKSYQIAHAFREKFHKECTTNTQRSLTPEERGSLIEKGMKFMHKAERLGQLNSGYLSRRLCAECLEGKKDGQKGEYTAEGFKSAKGEVQPYKNDKERIEYLKRVDKGIYTEELKHRLAKYIGWSMIIGGILAIAAACLFSGGVPLVLLIIGLVAAVFFLGMESIYCTYDSSGILAWVRDGRYKEPEWIKQLERSCELESMQELLSEYD